jgi:hypothetical protein
LKDEAPVRAGVVNVARWLRNSGFTNVESMVKPR